MDASEIVILHLISVSLFGTELDVAKLENVDWSQAFSLACRHGVAAICFDAFDQLPKELRPERSLLLQWMGVVNRVENDFEKKAQVLKEIVHHLENSNICVYLLKGTSVANYFPHPNHRPSTDLDIYLGDRFQDGNEILKSIGAKETEAYHRHVSFAFNGVSVENHCMLSDTKGRKDNVCLENHLVEIARSEMKGKKGILYPSNRFNVLFIGWHNDSHFMFENMTLRHLCDWAVMLRYGFQDVDMDEFMYYKQRCTFGKLADVLTAMSIRWLHLQPELIPQPLVESANKIPGELVDKVLSYMVTSDWMERDTDRPLKIKIDLAKRMLRDKWKFREVYDMNVWRVLLSKMFSKVED